MLCDSSQPASVATKALRVAVHDGTLVVHANLLRADYNAFQKACAALMASSSSHKTVTLDLTRCTYLSSLFIGTLVDTVVQMKADGKIVAVCVSPEIGHFLNMAHLYHLFGYQIKTNDD